MLQVSLNIYLTMMYAIKKTIRLHVFPIKWQRTKLKQDRRSMWVNYKHCVLNTVCLILRIFL